MAHDVADHHAGLGLAQVEHIEPVAAHLLAVRGGHVAGRDIEAGQGRERGQQLVLQRLGHPVLAPIQGQGSVAPADGLLQDRSHQDRADGAHGQCHPRGPGSYRPHQGVGRRHGQGPVARPHGEGQVQHLCR